MKQGRESSDHIYILSKGDRSKPRKMKQRLLCCTGYSSYLNLTRRKPGSRYRTAVVVSTEYCAETSLVRLCHLTGF